MVVYGGPGGGEQGREECESRASVAKGEGAVWGRVHACILAHHTKNKCSAPMM